MPVPSPDRRSQDEPPRAEIKERPASRFPLPGLALALLLVAFVHGPLLTLPALFDEAPFLAGKAESRGATLAMQWLPLEVAWLGGGATAHRVLAFVVELALLVAAAFLARRTRRPGLALLALAACLVHPWRTESFVRLGARAVVLSELFALAAVALALQRKRWAPPLAALAAALACSGLPLLALAPLAWLALAPREQRVAALVVGGGALAGVAGSLVGAPAAATATTTFVALDLMLRPWRTGLEHLHAALPFALGGAVAIAALLLVAMRRVARGGDRGPLVLSLAALVAWLAAPGLRPARTGLEYLGAGMTPEGWLPFLLLLAAALVALCGEALASRLPLLAFAGLAVGGGFVHAKRFEPPLALLDHALEVEPASVELQVLRAQFHVVQGRLAKAESARAFAEQALQVVARAEALRPGDPAVRSLEVLALAIEARLEEARAASDALLAAWPDDWRARASRAEVEAIAGDSVAALRWMRSAVAAAPLPHLRESAALLLDDLYAQLRTLLADRRWEGARKLAQQIAEVAPEELPAREAYVDTFTLAGQFTQALAATEELLATWPRAPSVVQRMASLHERLGHADEAARWKARLRELQREGGAR
jgi:tetratricopeptide (TPR) repeat protein